MTPSLAFAAIHHFLAFALVSALAIEFATVRRNMGPNYVRLVGRVDIAYGTVFVLLLVVGFSRALFFEKGWDYYTASFAFWFKIGLYLCAAAASIRPTITFIRWSKALTADKYFRPEDQEVALIRRFIFVQAAILAGIPVLAAMLARGAWMLG